MKRDIISAMSESSVDVYYLAKSKILDHNGTAYEASTLWRNSKAVLVFLRHFGCIACRAQAVQVWQNRATLEKNNTKVYFIGNGAPHFIEGFKQELGLSGAGIFTDPTLEIFKHCGFKRGFLNVVSYKSIVNAVDLYQKGHRQTELKAKGDHWQLGGIVAINPDSKVTYHYISEALGDFPPEKDVT